MIIENPEYREVTIHDDWGDHTETYVMLPKGVPSRSGATILKVGNLTYFLEMYTLGDTDRYLRPYEILSELEKEVWEDVCEGEIKWCYMINYKRDPMVESAYIIFDFSHFEVNTETEPDENYRSFYIYFDFSCSAS